MTATNPPTNPPGRAANPHAKRPRKAAIDDDNNGSAMGRQSQQRINQIKRKFNLASNSPQQKRRQQTLFGGNVFDAIKDCQVCKARHLRTFIEGYRVPNGAHHPLCAQNSTTKGKGVLSDQQKLSLEDNK